MWTNVWQTSVKEALAPTPKVASSVNVEQDSSTTWTLLPVKIMMSVLLTQPSVQLETVSTPLVDIAVNAQLEQLWTQLLDSVKVCDENVMVLLDIFETK